MKNKWLTFVDLANALDVGNVPAQVGAAGFSRVSLNQTSACLGLAASCSYCNRSVNARVWVLPPTDLESQSLLAASTDRVRRLPQSSDTKLVLEHLMASSLLVATEHGDVLDDCDCDFRLHISFGRLGQYMSYVDDRGFADEVEHYLELEPE